MSSQVDDRANDLVYAPHRERLKMRLDDIKRYTPQLASSMKLAVSSTSERQLLAKEEAIKQRDIVVTRIVDALLDIIRTLQLTHLIKNGLEPIDMVELRRTRDNMNKKMLEARRWLREYSAPTKGPGELAVRCIISDAIEIADKSGLGYLAELVHKKASKCSNETDNLCNLRDNGLGTANEGIRSSQEVEAELDDLLAACDEVLNKADELQALRDEINKLLEAAHEWLADPDAKSGPGSEAIHDICKTCQQIAGDVDPASIQSDIMRLCENIEENMSSLEPLRNANQGNTPIAKNLSFGTGELLGKLINTIDNALSAKIPAKTLDGRLEQTKKWLGDPSKDDDKLGVKAARAIIGQARKVAVLCPDQELSAILGANATEAENLMNKVIENLNRGDENAAQEAADKMDAKLDELKANLEDALTASIAEKFADTGSALKKLKDAAKKPKGTPRRDENYNICEDDFIEKAKELSSLARAAAEASTRSNNQQQEAIRSAANKLDLLTDQVSGAARVVYADPDNSAATEHFENTCDEWTHQVEDLTALVDDTTDAYAFVCRLEQCILKDHNKCENAMKENQPHALLPCAAATARKAHRILMVTKREAENSEDKEFVSALEKGFNSLNRSINPMIAAAKNYANNSSVIANQNSFLDANGNLMAGVAEIKEALAPKIPPAPEPENFPPPPLEELNRLEIQPPTVPNPPEKPEMPSRPPTPDIISDDEADPQIQEAAKETMEMLKQFESKGNSLIAAAKKMALLMAKMSRLVQGGNKKELIKCAKDIARASNDVTRIATEIANQCTDRRIRNDMLTVLERIPTVATQLKILSTVKATMLGRNNVPENEVMEATEMLVYNAQNLMKGVRQVVKESEAATIKIRTDAGMTIRWVRKKDNRYRY